MTSNDNMNEIVKESYREEKRMSNTAIDYEYSPFFLRNSKASERRARVKITPREKGISRVG